MQPINANIHVKKHLYNLLLDNMLPMVEDLFGPRDPLYTVLDIEFVSDGPYIWYPIKGRPDIIIRLSLEAATNMSQACYQMAHETIHLLAPSGGQNANNLEEGIACYFAAYYMKNKLNEHDWRPILPSYKRALQLVISRLDEDIYCVRRLRESQPSFPKMSREAIRAEFPNLTLGEVDFLISKFDRNAG